MMVLNSERMYGEGVKSVEVRESKTYTVLICDDVKDIDGKIHHAWIVPARFNPLRFMNNFRYLKGDRTLWIDSKGKQGNV